MRSSISAATEFAESLNYVDKNYNAEQVTRWLDGAEVNGAGKFIFVSDDEYRNIEKHPNWNITYHIVYEGDKLRRCGKSFAEDMIAADKGVCDGTRQEFKARRGW